MFVEFVGQEVIEGVARIVQRIRYSDGKRVKRVFNGNGKHIDSVPLPPNEGYYGELLNQGAYNNK